MHECTHISINFTLNWHLYNVLVEKRYLTSAYINFMNMKGMRKQIKALQKKFDFKEALSASVQGEQAS